jgi:hypothetical protein
MGGMMSQYPAHAIFWATQRRVSRSCQLLFFFSLSLVLVLGGETGRAATKANPTFFLDVTAGLSSTYKSKLVDSNDTGSNIMYAIGGNAGAESSFGFAVKTETNTTAFQLNESKVASTWQDAILRYNIGYFYLGLTFTDLTLKVNNAGTETVDSIAKGYGANLGFFIPFGRAGIFYFDAMSNTLSTVWDKLAVTTYKGASRTDADLGFAYNITRESFVLLVGYKQRTGSITTDSSYSEQLMTTYFGFRTALFF